MIVDIGARFGKLLVTGMSGRAKDGHQIWVCTCDCGRIVHRATGSLRAQSIRKSCGCALKGINSTHGMRYTTEWNIWNSAKTRCVNPNSKDYAKYGGRGIQMCKEWMESFAAFFAYVCNKPVGMTLDRINVDGNYEPGNVRWATPVEQARNKRASTYIEWRGKRLHLAEVAGQLGISYGAAFMRFKRGKIYDSLS